MPKIATWAKLPAGVKRRIAPPWELPGSGMTLATLPPMVDGVLLELMVAYASMLAYAAITGA